jgi:glycosyltransferase involved in cell wall biosynthesis
VKVLLLNQFFHPDLAATAQLATDLAEDLASQGARVTAVATRGTYLGGERLAAEEEHRAVHIVRVPCTSLGKASIARRTADYGTFYASAALRLATRERPDVVVAMSTPPLVATLGAAMRTTGARFVYWVQDVYPELAVEFGVLRAGTAATRALDIAARVMLGRADAVVAIGEAMARRLVAKGARADRVHVIPNWADGASVFPVAHRENRFRQEHELNGRTVFLYSGNMGRGHDIETLLAAAKTAPDATFLFVGDGAKRKAVEKAARESPWIRLLPYQPRERLAESLSAGDVHLVAQDANTLGLIEPSKLYGILAAGRPVLYVGPAQSEVARTIEREGVGAVVPNGDVAAATAALRVLLDYAPALGVRARTAFEAAYDRRRRTAEFAAVLDGLVAERAPGETRA